MTYQPDPTAQRSRYQAPPNPKKSLSVGTLISELPQQAVTLVKAEIERLKREMIAKLKAIGVGAGLFVGALVFLIPAFFVLIAAAICGLSVVFPPWLSCLIVAGVFIIIAVILVLVGLARFKKGTPLTPEDSIDSLREDVNAVRGLGHYE